MRPLATVMGLLLAGAALACSDSVPPPGATLSGHVWIDANANGLRDICDPPGAVAVGPVLELRDSKGQLRETKAKRDGTFTFTDVPPGDYELAVQQEESFQWPVTAPRDGEDSAGYELGLRGYEKLDGLDFSVAGQWPISLYPHEYGLVVVAFNDLDSDGEPDADECPLSPAAGLSVSVDGEHSRPALKEAVYRFEDLRQRPRSVKTDYASGYQGIPVFPTIRDPAGCAQPVTPEAIAGSRLFLAAVAMRPSDGTATVTATAFVDLDADGNRDEGEPPWYLAVTMTGACEDGPRWGPDHGPPDTNIFSRVPAGTWHLEAAIAPAYGDFDFETVATTPSTVELNIRDNDEIDVPFGLSFPGAAFVRVQAFRDDNLNGVVDSQEPPLATAIVCYAREEDSNTQSCEGPTASDGTTVLGPLDAGAYNFWVVSSCTVLKPAGPEAYSPVTVAADEVVQLTIPNAPQPESSPCPPHGPIRVD